MIYIYRPRNSTGARELAEGITQLGTVARRTKGAVLANLTADDKVVCWGAQFAAPANVKTLNNLAPLSKFSEAETLKEAGVSTVTVSRQRPAPVRQAPVEVPNPLVLNYGRVVLNNRAQAEAWVAHAVAAPIAGHAWARAGAPQPAPIIGEWLPRKNNHIGGNDLLLDEVANPDFYSKKENIVEEYRLHIFKGKSIRAGKKTHRDGVARPHAWIRSFDAGWYIKYDGFQSTPDQRKLAIAAVKALKLDFGAVDMGKRADGSLIVLEVNRAPGVEGGTIAAYAKVIKDWATGVVRD